MAMQKVYNRINWENYPSLDTPLNEQNLNKIDVATNELDNRVITHENVKATKEEVAPLITNVTFNEKTGVFTFTRKNGSSFTIDTLLEKIQTNWDYDPQTQKLILTMEDGTTQEIDLSELITQFEFVDTATIDFSIDNSTGKVSAIVKEGSIEEKHLRPNYLADVKVEVAKAEAASSAAELSAGNAKKSETAAAKSASDSANSASESSDSADASAASAAAALASQNAAKASETAAKNSQTAAKTSETNAGNSATAAKTSETNAGKSATAAAGSATEAATSAAESAESAENAATSETNAGKSASAAATSEKNAKTAETNATTQATSAKNSATSAATSASTATTKASEAATSASNAASSAETATRQATSASTSASTATTQANAAKTSATNAATSATKAQSYAEGGTGTRTGEDTDNAKYYYEQSKSISESFSGALRPMGTVTFANLPTLSSVAGGNMYNISDDFTTTADFKEGAGHLYPAGTNVYKTADGKWDCLAGTPVSGVKGDSETSYRRGNVNISKANIGLENVGNFKAVSTVANQGLSATEQSNARANIGITVVNNTADSSKKVAYATSAGSAALLSVQADNYKDANALPSTYPRGETVFFSNNPTNKFNGITYCTVHTIKGYGNMVCIQFIYPYNTNGDTVYYRTAIYNSDTWRAWQTIATTAQIPTSLPANGGNATTATKLATARTIFGKTFDGTGNVEGQGLFYGTYNANTNALYFTAALQLREKGLVGNAQSDIKYAPGIGFHWGNKTGTNLIMASDGKLHYLLQNGTSAGTIVATLEGNASTATTATTATNADTVDGKHASDLQNYNNLTNKPAIPSVGNGTLTIQRNGSTVATFTANQTGNVTANITDADTNTDVNVTQTVTTANANYPLLLSSATTTGTRGALFDSGVTLNPSTNVIAANVSGSAGSVAWANVSGRPTIPAAVAVKGNAESTYRTGNVNITAANIGITVVNNTADSAKNVASAVKWNGYTLWFGTEAQYTAIATKDSKTIYFRS